MERLPIQALRWRVFALLVALLLALISMRSPLVAAPSLTMAGAKTVYWLFAPLGLLGYAFGFRLFGQTFWRFYAVIFCMDITWRSARLMLTGPARPPLVIAIAFFAICIMCLALLRHANLIGTNGSERGPTTQPSRPGVAVAASRARPPRSTHDGAAVRRLDYKRGALAGNGVLLLVLAVGGAMIAVSPPRDSRGLLRMLNMVLGPTALQVCLISGALLIGAGALRVIWLAWGGALAVETGPRGIVVRSPFFTGSLPWSSVGHITGGMLGWGTQRALVIHRAKHARAPLRWMGLGTKIIIPGKFLAADDRVVEAWLATARQRDRLPDSGSSSLAVASGQRAFGRKQ